MRFRAAAAPLGLLLAACAGLPPQPQADAAALARMSSEPDRLVVIAVDNPTPLVATQAGSTPRGYDAMPHYGPGGDASAMVSALGRDYGLAEIAAWPIAPLKLHCVVARIPTQATRAVLLEKLAHDPRVRLAQPLQSFDTRTAAYNDPYVGMQRGFAEIDAAEAQQWSQADGVKVAVVDTGVDTAHPDLRGRVAAVRDFVGDGGAGFRDDRHGTAVAGVIAADANNHEGIVGVAPGVRIFAYKACWQLQNDAAAARCNSFTLAQALTAAIESDAQIVNLSLGGPPDPLLTMLVEKGLQDGIVFVAALPPDGRADGFPAGVPGVIAVGASDPSPVPAHVLQAPGRDILTLTPGGHYDFVSGSSIAAAHVSGAVALLLGLDPQLGAPAAFTLLDRSSTHSVGVGRSINACAALAALRGNGNCARPGAVAAQSDTPPR